MNTLAALIDLLLYTLFAATTGLVIYKLMDLYWPKLIGKRALADQLGHTEAQVQAGIEQLESGLTALAILASAAPFIGLAGTVLHIIEALRSLGTGVADMSLISGPIATALNSTLVGMGSAIPAAVAHAAYQRRLQVVENRQRRLFAVETV